MPTEKLLAEWFWIDRWVGSSAFGLSISARGLYREMLTQSWRRQARLPNDHEQIRRMTGVTEKEWRATWPLVQPYWRVDGAHLVNDTQIEIYAQAVALTVKRSAAGRLGNEKRWGHRKDTPSDSQTSSQTASQSDGKSVADGIANGSPPNSELHKEQEQERGGAAALAVGTNNGADSTAGKSSTAAAVRYPANGNQNPDDNVAVITKLVHTVLDVLGMQTNLVDLAEGVKDRCAFEHIAYNSAVVGKAIDSALVQRKRKT